MCIRDIYKDLRASEDENSGEHIFMIQREAQDAGAPFHFGLLPYPEQPISITPVSYTHLEVTNCDLAVVGATLIDAKGMYIVPGGVEIHVHGGGGRDFMEGTEEAFRAAVATHMKHGTTSIFPPLSLSLIHI